ncbi:hypothetical protein OIU80_17060 [Flavobacterium sp. LS1R47]|jgi:hypothetical protein|uniref:Uncharacterized protein n=1 Tax=Flavobacterium frigoritolerans TaxID=2987686 RepID=A0A9X3C9C5_9FLAO|nr:hypothetical protein [Flavobacterium frigoritolerans]MCV9933994.1 hypothetical protein [Flavobacterium frigoritolerans]
MNRIVLILMGFSLSVFSQNKEPSKEEKEMIYKITYEISKATFKVPDFPFKKVNRRIDEIQKKIIQSEEVINSSVDTLISRGVLKLEKSEYGYDLLFNSRFPSYYKENEEVYIVDFHPVTSKLFNLKKELIEIKNVGGTSFGSEFMGKYKNGKVTNLNYTTLRKQDQVNNAVNFKNNNELSEIQGSVIYNIKFITDYSQVKLSQKDIGSKFRLNDIEYKLIDIINNVVLIEVVDSKNLDRNNKIHLINYDEIGNVLVNYSDKEVAELKKKNKKINDKRAGYSDLSGNVNKRVFDAFKANPAMTFEEYQKTFTIDDIVNQEGKYIFIETIAPIKNDFVLYEPIYGIERTFEMIPNLKEPEPKKMMAADYNAPQLSAEWDEKLFGNIKEYTENFYYAIKKNGKYVKGKMQNYTTYKKNSNGEFVKDEMFPKKSDYPENKYNSLKQKIESIMYDDEENVLGKTIYSYGPENKVLEEKSYSSDNDTLRNVVKYEYNKNRIIKTSFSYDYQGGETQLTESQDELVYDEKGNLIEEHSKNNKEDSVYLDEMVIYRKYNSENRRIEESSSDSFFGDGKIKLTTKLEYLKIDNQKNWTEMFFEGSLSSEKSEASFVERIFVYE